MIWNHWPGRRERSLRISYPLRDGGAGGHSPFAAHAATAEGSTDHLSTEYDPMNDQKILFVDDEKPILSMLEKAFSKEGYQVSTAQTADAALSILQDKDIHVMFFDLKMPGISGLELCRQVRRERPMDMIFALTGYTSLFELSEYREAGFDDYSGSRWI
jgi:CheY-like chemotaxis protein